MDKKFAFGTFCTICSAITSFLFGAVCVFSYFKSGDIMWIPFAVIGMFGSLVMYANRK